MENIVEKRRNCSWGAISPLFHNIFNISLTSKVQLPISLLNVVNQIIFSSILQTWYVELRISRSISESPLEFEITRVDCIVVVSSVGIKSVVCIHYDVALQFIEQICKLLESIIMLSRSLQICFILSWEMPWCLSLTNIKLILVKLLFVCVQVLRPSQPNWVMSSAVSLPNHTFTGQT